MRQVRGYRVGTIYTVQSTIDPQVSYGIKGMSERMRRKLIGLADGLAGGNDKSIQMAEELVTEWVAWVKGYATMEGTPIETGADLAEYGETEFLAEAMSEIMLGVSLHEEKKSSEKSADSSNGSSGTVSSVAPTDSMVSVVATVV